MITQTHVLEDYTADILTEDTDLLVSVRPPGWKNPQPIRKYDLLVLGAGPAGVTAAQAASGRGAKVALVERRMFGGNCVGGSLPLNIMAGLTHTKTRCERLGACMPAASEFAELAALMQKTCAQAARRFSVKQCSARGIMVFFGNAMFLKQGVAEVTGHDGLRSLLNFDKAIIATGSRAAIPGADDAARDSHSPLLTTSDQAFIADELPGRLIIIGAGHIGCRLAQMFARLGSEVTIIEEKLHLLPSDDHDASRVIAEAFENDGINMLLDTALLAVEKDNGGKRVRVAHGGEERIIHADMIFADTGRLPNVDGLGLEALNIQHDQNYGILVDDTLRTANPNIYAAGDVCLPHRFAHVAETSARVAVHNIFSWRKRKMKLLAVPYCIHTDPHIAHVGMLPHQAEDRGIPVRSFIKHIDELDSTIIDEAPLGFVKVNTRRGREKILGCTIVAPEAAAMIGEFALAMGNDLGLRAMSGVHHPYPSTSQAIDEICSMHRRIGLGTVVRRILDTMLARRG